MSASPTAADVQRPKPNTRLLALSAVGGALTYIAIDIVLRILRPDLRLLHNAESDYGNGPYSWLMDINFELRCLFSIAAGLAIWTAFPLRRLGRAGVLLIWVWAISSGVVGFFRDDLEGAAPTPHGTIHLIAALVGFPALAIGTLLLTIELRRFAVGRMVVCAAALVWVAAALSLVALGHAGIRPHTLGGLYERIFIGMGILWILVVSGRIALLPLSAHAATPTRRGTVRAPRAG